MLDDNRAADESKLEYIAQIPKGRELLMNLMQKNQEVVVSDIEDRFGIKKMLADKSKDNTFFVSFLYYFGFLTIAGDTDGLEVILKLPNLVMKSLYVERIYQMLLPEPSDRDDGKKLEKRYGNLRLQKFVVVSLGFERICFKKCAVKTFQKAF